MPARTAADCEKNYEMKRHKALYYLPSLPAGVFVIFYGWQDNDYQTMLFGVVILASAVALLWYYLKPRL